MVGEGRVHGTFAFGSRGSSFGTGRDHKFIDDELNKPGAFGLGSSEQFRDNKYWIVYILGAYQPRKEADGDPDREDLSDGAGRGGISNGVVGGGSGIRGAILFHETMRESLGNEMLNEFRKRVVLHEIGHEFNIADDTGGIYDYEYINNPYSVIFTFNQEQRNIIRSKQKSPGELE